jgi:hypothetical protein
MLIRQEAMLTSAVENNAVKDWEIETLISYLGNDEKHFNVLYMQEITDSNPKQESPQAKSAEFRKQVRNLVAELRGVDSKLIPYPRSNNQLSEYCDEIIDAELSQQKKSKSAEHRKEARNQVSKSNSKFSEYCNEIYDTELSPQAKSAEIRKQARIRLAKLKGVNPKSILYPRSNDLLSEYNDEIKNLEEAERKVQKEYQLEKLDKVLKETEETFVEIFLHLFIVFLYS